jgi:cytochrome c oxidase assembly protein subunit 15
MPFDVRDFPGAPSDERSSNRRDRLLVAAWLFAVCAMILIMIGLGGLTRLTGSGLSIMEWAPLSGVLPPMSDAEWDKLFALYQTVPQYYLLHAGFGLDGFKQIFWLEWIHRLWGRLIGITFLVPLVWFWATGRIGRRLRVGLATIFLIGGLQGAVGWFMVASGFQPDSISVAPLRLTIHFILAVALYSVIFWTALNNVFTRPSDVADSGTIRALLWTFCALALTTMIAGTIVAGTHVGFEYNSFPLIEGRWVPENYSRLEPFLLNLASNPAAVQFNHRILATLTMILGVLIAVMSLLLQLPRPVRIVTAMVGLLALAQYGLGVATLLLVVPQDLAVAHQVTAVLLLTAALTALHQVGPAPRRTRPIRRAAAQ